MGGSVTALFFSLKLSTSITSDIMKRRIPFSGILRLFAGCFFTTPCVFILPLDNNRFLLYPMINN